jgi:hypothetical protein
MVLFSLTRTQSLPDHATDSTIAVKFMQSVRTRAQKLHYKDIYPSIDACFQNGPVHEGRLSGEEEGEEHL